MNNRNKIILAVACLFTAIGLLLVFMNDPATSNVQTHKMDFVTLAVIDIPDSQQQTLVQFYTGMALILTGLALTVTQLFSKKEVSANSILTQKEQTIVEAIERGLSNKEIAQEQFISLSTVKSHTNNIYRKMGVNSRHELLNML